MALDDLRAAAPFDSAGVVGAGTMGVGIALCLLQAGIRVTLTDAKAMSLAGAVEKITTTLSAMVAKGRIPQDEARSRLAKLQVAARFESLAQCDIVIEAVVEDMGVKLALFRQLDSVCKPGAVLATNTSTLDVGAIAAATQRPGDVVGLHFFSPAHVMKLLEIVTPPSTSAATIARSFRLARALGKHPVQCGVCDGFIGNRMLAGYFAMANHMVALCGSPREVDAALERFGMAMGPMRMNDMAGIDVGWAIRKRRSVETGRDCLLLADRLARAGRLGQKSGAGWYRYDDGSRTPIDDAPGLSPFIEEWRSDMGIQPRQVTPEEIVDACILALVNEGARILEEGIAQSTTDIDTVYLEGYGFPRRHGGPMSYAQRRGWRDSYACILRLSTEYPAQSELWQPAALLARWASDEAVLAQTTQ
jgi:3-hydroxyacyl-CoA dehydrogenase